MNDLYEAMGSIAAAAHANGDTIDENIRPEDNHNVEHGFDIFHRSNYMRIGKRSDEQRFEITSPYVFLNVLEQNYSDAELDARVDIDLSALPPQERRQAIQSALEADLREASAQYDEFAEAYSQEIEPNDTDLIRITYGEEDLWNGFYVRDHLYPFEESFSIRSDEQRFEITSPYVFLNVLEQNYSDAELDARVDIDLSALPPQERRQAIQSALEADLREASTQYDEFAEAYSQEIEPNDTDLIRITHGEDELWNGFYVRDHLYPFEESFSISEYRRAVSKVRRIRIQTTKLAHDIVDVLDTAGSEELSEEPATETQSDHQPSPPGFQ